MNNEHRKVQITQPAPSDAPGEWPDVGEEGNVIWYTTSEVHCCGFDSVDPGTFFTLPRSAVRIVWEPDDRFALLKNIGGHTVSALLRPSGHVLHVTEGQAKTRGLPAPLDEAFSSWDDLVREAHGGAVIPLHEEMKTA